MAATFMYEGAPTIPPGVTASAYRAARQRPAAPVATAAAQLRRGWATTPTDERLGLLTLALGAPLAAGLWAWGYTTERRPR